MLLALLPSSTRLEAGDISGQYMMRRCPHVITLALLETISRVSLV
jgi:hypothetical protein